LAAYFWRTRGGTVARGAGGGGDGGDGEGFRADERTPLLAPNDLQREIAQPRPMASLN